MLFKYVALAALATAVSVKLPGVLGPHSIMECRTHYATIGTRIRNSKSNTVLSKAKLMNFEITEVLQLVRQIVTGIHVVSAERTGLAGLEASCQRIFDL